MLGFLLADLTMPGLKVVWGPESCPATGCNFVGPSRSLTMHWRSFHDPRVLLYLCPLPGCRFHTPRPQGLRVHWEGRHSASRPQSQQLRTLPLLAEFVVNRQYKPQGTGSGPVPPLQRPLGSLPHTGKEALLVQVEGILCKPEKAPTPAPISQVVPPCMKAVCEVDRRMVVETAAIATPPGVVLPTPVVKAPVQVDLAQQVSSVPDSPIMIASSPSFQHSFSSKSASPISPAFTVISTLSLAFRMSSSRSLLGSPILPPVTSPTSDRDPVFAQRSPLLQEPPTPTRALLDEFVPSTPSATLPASVEVLFIPPSVPAASAQPAALPKAPSTDQDTLISCLKDLDGRRACVEVEWIGVLQELACLESEELRGTWKQLQEAQHRCQLLEKKPYAAEDHLFPYGRVWRGLTSHLHVPRPSTSPQLRTNRGLPPVSKRLNWT